MRDVGRTQLHNKRCPHAPCFRPRVPRLSERCVASMLDADVERLRWHASQRLTAGLLAIWFVVTFGIAFYARELGGRVGGWPFSFWVAAQGAPLVYVVLTWAYARLTDRLDATFGATQDD